MLCLEAAQTLRFICQTVGVVFTADGFELSAGVETYKILGQSFATTPATNQTLYTVPASTQAFIKKLFMVNTSSSATCQWFVGGTAQTNAITPVFTLPLGGYGIYEDGQWNFYDNFGREQLKYAV